jgi:WD40 repeat protein
LIGDSEEILRFRDAVRSWIEHAAADAGRDLREIPPAVLLSLLCASAFSAVTAASPGMKEAPTLGVLPSRVVLGDLISAAIEGVRVGNHGRPPSPQDLEREIYWRVERVLTAQDQRAAVLRTEIAAVLAETDALRSALLSAIETGNDRLRNDVIAAIDTLSSGYPEMAFLLRGGDHEAAQMPRRLDEQGAEFRTLSGKIRRQPADVRTTREDLAAIRHRQVRAGRSEASDADRGPRWDSGCPYRGLLPFDQEHAEVFYGRQRLTAELIAKLAGRLAGPSMVVVSGASGAGKSSLLHAALLPALAEGTYLEGSDGWARVVMTPTGDPLTELATRLAALSRGDATIIRHALAANPDQAHLVVGQAVPDGPGRGNGSWPPAAVRPERLVLIIDQFEEVFTLAPGRGDAGQQAFIAALCAAATQPYGPRGEPPAVVVISVRGDFWARCAAHAGLARLMQDGMFVVGPMTGAELREAITGPAAAAGLQIDADLADTILADLRTAGQDEAEGILPLLSQAMMLTWRKRDGHRLTAQGYRETGGVARSVEFSAEAVYEALPDAGQQVAREIFEALVLVGPDGQLARHTVPRAELAAGRRDAARRAVDTVLEAFASSRLLVLDGDTVQIAHDVLLRAWPRLRGWLDSEQVNWILYTQLQEDAAEWAEHGRDSSFLYRGSQLAAVEQAAAQWAADPARYPVLTGDQPGFLEASRQHAARSARTRRAAVLTLVLLVVLSLAGAGIAAQADRTANQQRNAALSRQLASESEAFDVPDPATASLLAAAAWSVAPTAQARVAMLDVSAQPVRAVLNTTSAIKSAVAFSPDGKTLAAAAWDGTIRLWDLRERREIAKLPDHDTTPAIAMTFSPNGRILAVVGYNNLIRLWDVAGLRPYGTPITGDAIAFSPAGDLVATVDNAHVITLLNLASGHHVGRSMIGQAVGFSPDGKIMAIANNSGEVLLWNTATQTPTGPPIRLGTEPVTQISFSPDGRVLATVQAKVGATGTVRLWNIASRREIGPKLPGNTVAFSYDGSILASEFEDFGAIRLWDAATGQQIDTTLTDDMNSFGPSSMAFSPDGLILATGDVGPVRLWDLTIYQQLGVPVAKTPNAFNTVALSPDGKQLAVAGDDRDLKVLDIVSRKHRSTSLHDGGGFYSAAAFSPNRKYLAAGTVDGRVVLWSAATHRLITTFTASTQISHLVFSPDSEFLAVSLLNNDGARVWNIRSLRNATPVLDVAKGEAADLSFNRDSKILATVSTSGTIRFWNISNGRLAGAPLTATDRGINAIAYSPNGSILAAAENNGTIQLWNPATRSQFASFSAGTPNHGGGSLPVVHALAFNPAGTLLATANADGTAKLWDLASYQQVGGPLTADSSVVRDVAFSADGRMLATTGDDGEAILWDVALPPDPQGLLCQIAGRSLDRAEWHTYAPAEPYRKVCLSRPSCSRLSWSWPRPGYALSAVNRQRRI